MLMHIERVLSAACGGLLYIYLPYMLLLRPFTLHVVAAVQCMVLCWSHTWCLMISSFGLQSVLCMRVNMPMCAQKTTSAYAQRLCIWLDCLLCTLFEVLLLACSLQPASAGSFIGVVLLLAHIKLLMFKATEPLWRSLAQRMCCSRCRPFIHCPSMHCSSIQSFLLAALLLAKLTALLAYSLLDRPTVRPGSS